LSKIVSIFLVFLFGLQMNGQNCDLLILGEVYDSGTLAPLEHVNVLVSEKATGSVSDEEGNFSIQAMCPGSYHLVISHIGCASQRVFLELEHDTFLTLYLDHSDHLLHDIEISSGVNHSQAQKEDVITDRIISDRAQEGLAVLLESVAGVNSIKNGRGIAKPIVQGLYGNRLTIVNNGVAQSGQQWGNDHSPEIDPLSAGKITVIKGAAANEFMGSNLGSIILVESERIEKEPHLHGKLNYFLESNGINNGANLQIQKYSPKLAWKISGTFKKAGDRKTSRYFLSNTGSQETNFNLQLEKSISEKWKSELYVSTFNTSLGLLKGSQIANLTDLASALLQDEPFFTSDKRSFSIDAPKQKVNHHLLKLNNKYFFDDNTWLEFTLASQLNNRKEFDVRRGDRSEIPSLSLKQYSHFAEAKISKEFDDHWSIRTGYQFNLVDNTNDPETGILPLIPDYRSFNSGAFIVWTKELENTILDLGMRYDNIVQNVVSISNAIPREIIRYDNTFHNISSSLGVSYFLSEKTKLIYNLGYTSRSPGINELYSQGLHQGVSGIEEGDNSLQVEKSLKTLLSVITNINNKHSLEAQVYYQHIKDYIYLEPQDEIRLTIRGAFPVFKYQQTDARIFGLDILGTYYVVEPLSISLAYNYIHADDLANNLPLINIPSNNVKSKLVYNFLKHVKIGNKKLENLELEINNKYVFRQNRILISQDFVAAPEAYNLVGMTFSGDLQLSSNRLRIVASVDNLLNTTYRDYLNRQRYFADDLGVNFTLGLSLKF